MSIIDLHQQVEFLSKALSTLENVTGENSKMIVDLGRIIVNMQKEINKLVELNNLKTPPQ